MREKIIKFGIGGLIVAMVALYFVSPTFRSKVIWVKDTINNWRYSASQSQRETTTATGDREEIALQCRNRMTSIEQAKQALLSQSGYVQAGTQVTYQDIARRLGSTTDTLVCPQTGAIYTLGGVADPVRCSVSSNGTPTQMADDHIIGR